MSYGFADSSQAVSKPVWHIPLLCVQWKTPDDGERNCPKHVEFHSKNKFEKLVHLIGFIIRTEKKFMDVVFERPRPWRNLTQVNLKCWIITWKTPDDGQRNCPKHVEFHSKNKFEKLVHLVGFIIRIYHVGRSHGHQIHLSSSQHTGVVRSSYVWDHEGANRKWKGRLHVPALGNRRRRRENIMIQFSAHLWYSAGQHQTVFKVLLKIMSSLTLQENLRAPNILNETQGPRKPEENFQMPSIQGVTGGNDQTSGGCSLC